MGKDVGVIIVLLFLVSIAFAAAPGDAAKGKDIYGKSCAGCHGPAGKGDGAAAAALNPKPTNLADHAAMSKLDDAALTNVIAKGGAATGKSPIMPAFNGQLKDQDIKDVVAYIRSLAK